MKSPEMKEIRLLRPTWCHDTKTDRHTNLFMVEVQYIDGRRLNVQFDIRLLLNYHLSQGLVVSWSTDEFQGLVIVFGRIGKYMPLTNDFNTVLNFWQYIELMVTDKDIETILTKE